MDSLVAPPPVADPATCNGTVATAAVPAPAAPPRIEGAAPHARRGRTRLARGSIAISVGVHVAVIAALWAGVGAAAPRRRPPVLELALETASAASEEAVATAPLDEPPPELEREPVPEPVEETVVEPPPTDEPVAPSEAVEPAPTPRETSSPDPTLRVPRKRVPAPTATPAAPPRPPVAPIPVAAPTVAPSSPTRSVARSAATGAVAWSSNRAPVYPTDARAAGIEGVVVLRLVVDETGAVREASVDTTSGTPSLDASALDAARSWHFSPARDADGRPVATAIRRRIRFVLDRG